jgi:hypothetical protein
MLNQRYLHRVEKVLGEDQNPKTPTPVLFELKATLDTYLILAK